MFIITIGNAPQETTSVGADNIARTIHELLSTKKDDASSIQYRRAKTVHPSFCVCQGLEGESIAYNCFACNRISTVAEERLKNLNFDTSKIIESLRNYP